MAGYLRVVMKNTCANCALYNWKQKEGKITLRCSGCKIFFYCSKDCQEEHWKKTHRQHCKHLTKLKVEAECKSKQDLDHDLELLSSLTSNPEDRTERVVKVMQGLLEKIIDATDSAAQMVEIEDVAANLLNMRLKIYGNRLLNPKKTHHLVVNNGFSDFMTTPSSDESDTLKNLKTLNLLFVQLGLIKLDQVLKSPEKSLPPAWRETSRKVREGPFLMVVDKILEALEDQEIPHSELVDIASGGNLEQNCTVCQKEITVTRMWYPEAEGGATLPVTASVYLCPLEGVVFFCGSLDCMENYLERLSFGMWGTVLLSTLAKLEPTRCDFCFLCAPLTEVHRSLCKTKNYCSKICRRADNDFHKVCCEEGGHYQVEERKVKIGGQEKVEVAFAKMKSSARGRLSSYLEKEPEVLGSSEFQEMLLYNINLMEKIQLRENRKLREVRRAEVDEVD